MPHIRKVKTFLHKSGFYAYRDESVPKKMLKEYAKTLQPSNKRNLEVKKSWEEIISLGPKRTILVLELGGSYLKLFDVKVKEGNKIDVKKFQSVQFYEDKLYTPEVLWGDIKLQLDAFVKKEERNGIRDCVFIFTFPIRQIVRKDGVIDAVSVKINKAVRSKGIVGLCIGESLQKYLRSRGYPNIVISVTNDSIINVLSAKGMEIMQNQKYDAAINIIVGTGVNIAVGTNVKGKCGPGMKMINTEFGGFCSPPPSSFDKIFHSRVECGKDCLTEKMISGLWQPHIFKIVLEECVKHGHAKKEILRIFDQVAFDAGEIEEALNMGIFEGKESDIYNYLWKEIHVRGAELCGMMLAEIMADLAKKHKKGKIDIALIEVGSVLKKSKTFKNRMIRSINEILAKYKMDGKVRFISTRPRNATALGASVFTAMQKEKA
jgi:hexokinase